MSIADELNARARLEVARRVDVILSTSCARWRTVGDFAEEVRTNFGAGALCGANRREVYSFTRSALDKLRRAGILETALGADDGREVRVYRQVAR